MKKEKGFTLLEVLIAIMIFIFGILVVGNMQITSIQGNSFAKSITEASVNAQNQIENLINSKYSDFNDITGDGVAGLNNTSTNPNDQNAADYYRQNGRYTIVWNIADNYPVSGTKTARVIVMWNERGRQKQIVFDIVKPNI